MDSGTRKQIELIVIRLENENKAKFEMLNFLHRKLSDGQTNRLLDEINANRALIEKLKKGLTEEDN